ncbi:MAG: DUF5996 family protein [Anaerolineae bacterium]
MTLPALANWEPTRTALHQAAQVVGGVRKVSVPALPNYAHLGLYVTAKGVTSGRLADGGIIDLNFAERALVYTCPEASVNPIPLDGHTQQSLADALLKTMADADHPSTIDRTKITGQTPLNPHPDAAAEYQAALHSVYSAIARFRGRLLGGLSPMIVWPHGFDLSTLWFAKGFEEQRDPHMNVGFSPGSAGFPRPYIYVYASPLPDAFFDVRLPQGARFTRETWKGIVIDYDFLREQANHELVLEGMLTDIFAALAPLMM